MYKPTNTTLSADSYTILNTIREQTGGEFRSMTPLVQSEGDLKAYGLYVTGSGDARNTFMTSLINRIAQVLCLVRSYQNPLKDFKRGILGPGEMVENVWVGLVMPEGYEQSPANPGDVFAVNNPENQTSFHPVNSKLVYETTTNDYDLSLAFTSAQGVYDLVSRIVQRLYDSSEWDEYILMKYTISRAILDNPTSVKTLSATLAKSTADDAITTMKEISNNMLYMKTGYNEMSVPTHTPRNDQIFFLTSAANAVIDVNALASAFNLEYKQFIGQRMMIDSFTFDATEQSRLDTIMSETVASGVIPAYTPFTDEEKATLGNIVGAIIDRDWFMIFDKLFQMNAIFDPKHLNTNSYLHVWKIFSHNPFANATFISNPTA